MNLLKAIPITRGLGIDLLTYWSPSNIPLGSMIKVPLRKKIVSAFVISCEPAIESKAEIKSAEFEIRKIEKAEGKQIVTKEFFKAIQESAHFHAASVGSTLFELIPSSILSQYEKFPEIKPLTQSNKPRESYILQKSDEDRYGHYKSLVRERFAQKESVFMMMPTIEDIKKAFSYFEKGIEPYTYIFHSGLTKNAVESLWKKCLDDTHPVIIVATGSFLSIPRHDIGLIIVERENSRAYKSQNRPFLNLRFVAERVAKHIKADLIFGDSNVRIETLWREEEGELIEYAPSAMRSLSTARDTLVDMKTYKNPSHDIRILSDELLVEIQKTREESGHMFIFAGRKGLAPQTICADCETTVICDKCSAPIVLHGKDDSRFYLCNRCGKRFDSHTTCRTCGGWRLTTLGIGTERVVDEIKKALPETQVFLLDKTIASTHKKALEITEKWHNSPGSILVGTELALLYLDKEIDSSAVATLDAFFSIPDFRINEKVFTIILRLRAIARKTFILQTRAPETPALALGVKGNIIDFYREEIEARRSVMFPPFSLFIKISYAGERSTVLSSMDTLKEILTGFEVDVFPAFIATVRGQYIMHALIKLPKNEWPNDDLLTRLRNLPPSYAVNVDPESIL